MIQKEDFVVKKKVKLARQIDQVRMLLQQQMAELESRIVQQNNEGTVSEQHQDTALQDSQLLFNKIDQINNRMLQVQQRLKKDAQQLGITLVGQKERKRLKKWKREMMNIRLGEIFNYDSVPLGSRKRKNTKNLRRKVMHVLSYQAKLPNALQLFVQKGFELASFVEESLSQKGVRFDLLEVMKDQKLFNLDISFLSIIRGFINFIESDRMNKEQLKKVIVKTDPFWNQKVYDFLSGIQINKRMAKMT